MSLKAYKGRQLSPNYDDQVERSFDVPDCKHVANGWEDCKEEELKPLLTHCTCKEAFMELSVLEFLLNTTGAAENNCESDEPDSRECDLTLRRFEIYKFLFPYSIYRV